MTREEELKLQAEWIKKNQVTLIPPMLSDDKLYTKPKRRKSRAKGSRR